MVYLNLDNRFTASSVEVAKLTILPLLLEREVPSLQSPFRFALDADAPAASAADVLCVMQQTVFGMEQRSGSVARYITFGTGCFHISFYLTYILR